MGISGVRLKELLLLIGAKKEHEFYTWPEWKALRLEVLKLDRYECQRCRETRHRYSKAQIVHHKKHLKERPDLALSIWDEDVGERQLISVCKRCHEELHPDSQRQFKKIYNPVTKERWD